MSSRWLIVISSVLSVLAVYIYMHRDKVAQPKAAFDARFDYWAEDISTIQTDDTGAVAMSVQAKKLTHELKTNTLVLTNMQAKQVITDTAEPNTPTTVAFSADKAVWQRNKHILTLADNVTLLRTKKRTTKHTTKTSPHRPSIQDSKTTQTQQLKAQDLRYHTKTKQLSTSFPVLFSSGKSYIKASAMRADLGTGIYQFDFLQAQFVP